MAKDPHWYLRSWEYEQRLDQDGTVRKELVYKGEYYALTRGETSLWLVRLLFLLPACVLWGVLGVLLTHFSRGSSLFFVGGPCALTLIPGIYLMIGAIRNLMVPEKMTYRDLRSGLERVRLSSKWSFWLLVIALGGEVFYLAFRLVNGLAIDVTGEGLWLVGLVLGVCVPLCYQGLFRKYRIELLPVEE